MSYLSDASYKVLLMALMRAATPAERAVIQAELDKRMPT